MSSRRRTLIIMVLGLVALPTLALAAIVKNATQIFSGRVAIGGTIPPLARLDVRGDADTSIRVDGSNTSGLSFPRVGIDGGTLRSTATVLEVWSRIRALALALQGNAPQFPVSAPCDG